MMYVTKLNHSVVVLTLFWDDYHGKRWTNGQIKDSKLFTTSGMKEFKRLRVSVLVRNSLEGVQMIKKGIKGAAGSWFKSTLGQPLTDFENK